jgi:hypothetical protein
MLAGIGLYRAYTMEGYALAASRFCARMSVAAPVQDPRKTFHEIRTICNAMLPTLPCNGACCYSLIWRKP